MGMLEDERRGLTTDQAGKSRAMYMHSIDPENNPDPNAPEPIPMFAPGEEPGVQPDAPSINNVQAPKVDEEENPFEPAGVTGEDENPFEPSSAEDAEEESPFSAYPPVEPEPEPEPEPAPEEEGNILDAAGGGVKSMWNSVKTSWNAAFSDNEAVEELVAASQGIDKTAAQERMLAAYDKNTKGEEDDLLGTIGGAIQTAWEEPQGLAHESAAQAANMAPIWAGGIAGGKLGAVAGAMTGPAAPVAVPVLTVVGAVAGMFVGNLSIEGGFAVQEEAMKPGMISDEEMSGALGGAAKKAAVITAVDTLTMGANRLMFGAPGRAATAAVSSHLVSKGIDAADDLAVRAALEASPELLGEVMEVSAKTLFDATGSIIGKKGARGAVALGLETTSEGVGEYFGTLASGKDATYSEAVMEAMMAGPTSAAEAAFTATYKMGMAQIGPTKEAAADLDAAIGDADALDTTVDENLVGPLPQTPEAAEAELEAQGKEAEGRAQAIENAQDSARERVLANGGDLLDAELEASNVARDMGAADDDIQRHLAMVNRQTQKGIEKRAEAEKVTKENAKSKIQESRKRIEEDKAYEQVDKVSGIGQTGDVGYIAGDTTADKTVAGKESGGVVRGNQMADAFAKAANEAATSPENDLAPPTPAQKEAGNYKKGHVRKHGLDITIENPAGSTREAADGSWKQNMKDHYGYIKGTTSAEGKTEQLDVFIGEGEGIFVVDQIDKDGNFDEHKVMMGYNNPVEARRAYARNYPQGFKVGKIAPMTPQKFKEWLKNGDMTQPVQPIAKAGGSLAASAGQKKEVIQPKTLDGERTTRTLSAAEQAEKRIEQMPGRKVRYRREDTENTIQAVAPRDVMEELEYLSEGYEEGPNLKQALEDAIDDAELGGNRKFLNKLRTVGIEVGMFREMPQEEIDRTQTTKGTVWDFSKGGKKYVFNADGYKTEMQDVATEMPIMYHGAPKQPGMKGISRFQAGKDDGIYFSSDPSYAEGYAKEFRAGTAERDAAFDSFDNTGAVYQTELDVKNPLVINEGEPDFEKNLEKYQNRGFSKAQLIKDGYDGVVINYTDGEVEAMVLKNDQIKSVAGKGAEKVRYRKEDEVQATHYSNVEGLSTLKGEKYGTGIRGKEAERLSDPDYADIKERVYFYGPEHQKEPGLGRNKYTWTQKGLYDMDADADGLKAKVQAWAKKNQAAGDVNTKANQLDRMIKEAGYTGVISPRMNGIGYVFGNVPLAGQIDAEKILSQVKKDGDGFTIDNATGEAKKSGFAAGIGMEKQFEDMPTAADIDAYRESHAAALAEEGNYLGGWMDGGVFFLDVSKVYPNNDMGRQRAYDAAKSRGEYGIQDLSKPPEEGYIPIEYAKGEMEAIRSRLQEQIKADKGPLKRRGEGVNIPMTSARAKEVLAPMMAKLPLMKPVILANPSEAPAELRAQMEKDGALKAKGVFDPETGVLTVFSENHETDEDLIRTLIHEGVAHKGTRYLLGDNFDSVMQDVYDNGDRKAINRIAKKYGLDLTQKADRLEAAEEYLAFVAENGIESSVYQRALAAIRRALRRLGLVKEWTESDAQGLLRRSRGRLKGKPMAKANITTEFQIEETGEIITTSTPADRALRQVAKRKAVCEKLRECVS